MTRRRSAAATSQIVEPAVFPAISRCRRLLAALVLVGLVAPADAAPVEIVVRDKKSGQPVPCRTHLKNAGGKPQRAPDLPFWFDHFVCPGRVNLELGAGKYRIEIERGPEYSRVAQALEITGKAAKF